MDPSSHPSMDAPKYTSLTYLFAQLYPYQGPPHTTYKDEDEIMVSFNVTALFTSIDPELAKESMVAVLHNSPNLSKYTKIRIPRIMDLISLCLTGYFQFDGDIRESSWDCHSWDS